MPFFTKKSPVSTEVVFDIESDSVCAAVVRYEDGKVPLIVYHAETEVARKTHTDGAYLTRNMLKALEIATESVRSALSSLAEKKTVESSRIGHIHVVLSSPWIISRLSCVEKTFEKETIVRHGAISDMLEKERTASAKLFAVGDSAAIDAKLFEIKINGYPVADYENKRARSLEGTMVVSFASRKMLSDIKSRINRSLRASDESFHSALILRYVALRSILPHRSDYVWLQIHGELTDVLSVREGACSVNGSLPFGTDTLVRKFASLTNESESTAGSLLDFLDSSSNTVLSLEKTRGALEKVMPEWAQGIASLVSAGGKGSTLPPVVYVSAGHFSTAFEQALKRFSPSTTVKRADPAIVAPFVEYAPSVPADLSVSLYCAALPLSKKM
ncbi:MAG: hypothetical protein P4L61_03670 [Candidatus Pacebacteria bacterium]|nr:hypothetical protein [Candidatus Paceibacterota bacterium]